MTDDKKPPALDFVDPFAAPAAPKLDFVDPFNPATLPAAAPARRDRTGGEQAQDIAASVGTGTSNILSGTLGLLDQVSKVNPTRLVGGGTLKENIQGIDTAITAITQGDLGLLKNREDGADFSRIYEGVNAGLAEAKSDPSKQAEQELADTSGFWDSAKKVVTDPLLLEKFVAEQVPNLLAMGAGTRSMVAKQMEAGLAAGMTPAAARAAALKAAAAQGVVFEGVQEGGLAALQNQTEVRRMSFEELAAQAPAFVELVQGGMTPEAAREALAEDAALYAAPVGFAAGVIGGKIAAPFEARAFTGGLDPGGLSGLFSAAGARTLGAGVAKEAAEEAVQEGGAQIGQNLGIQQTVDPTRTLAAGVPEAAGAGAGLGAVIGGGLGAAGIAAKPKGVLQRVADDASGQQRAQSDAARAAEAQAAAAAAFPNDDPEVMLGELRARASDPALSPQERQQALVELQALNEASGRALPAPGGFTVAPDGTTTRGAPNPEPWIAPGARAPGPFGPGLDQQAPLPRQGADRGTRPEEPALGAGGDGRPPVAGPADDRGGVPGREAPAAGPANPPDDRGAPAPDLTPKQQDGDILARMGSDKPEPFRNRAGAASVARRVNGQVVELEGGGYVVRPTPPASGPAPTPGAPAPAPAPASPAAAPAAAAADAAPAQAGASAPATAQAVRPAEAAAVPSAEPSSVSGNENSTTAGDVRAKADAIAEAANIAATSHTNQLTASPAQKEAGNYQKGHVRVAGLDISIENAAGTARRPEWGPLVDHYGYIKGSVGKDKDHVDVFITADAADESRPVFVVDQKNKAGAFDEHKVILGAADETAAREAYQRNYTPGWKGLGKVTQMTQAQFKAWVRDKDATKLPASKADLTKYGASAPAATPAPAADAPAAAARPGAAPAVPAANPPPGTVPPTGESPVPAPAAAKPAPTAPETTPTPTGSQEKSASVPASDSSSAEDTSDWDALDARGREIAVKQAGLAAPGVNLSKFDPMEALPELRARLFAAAKKVRATADKHKQIDADFAANRKERDRLQLKKGDVVHFEGGPNGELIEGTILDLGDKDQAVIAVGVPGARGVRDMHVPARQLEKGPKPPDEPETGIPRHPDATFTVGDHVSVRGGRSGTITAYAYPRDDRKPRYVVAFDDGKPGDTVSQKDLKTAERRGAERPDLSTVPADERDQTIAELRNEVRTDDLTGLLNAKAWRRDVADGSVLPHVAMIDLDLFKGYNDLLGYEGADEALKAFGQALLATSKGGAGYRRGGDEFILTAKTPEALAAMLKRLNAAAAKISLELTGASGERMTVTSVPFSSGTGTDEQSATAALKQSKAGKPSSRDGAQPANIAPAGRGAAGVPAAQPEGQDEGQSPVTPAAKPPTKAELRAREREAFANAVADLSLEGKSLDELRAHVQSLVADLPLDAARIETLAAEVHKAIGKASAKRAKERHRDPAVRDSAIGERLTQAYPTPTDAQRDAFNAGFHHALGGKTKSTLSGDELTARQRGYEAGKSWIRTEVGRAFYEGRPVNKLENTGADLRRWYEALKAQAAAKQTSIDKAWKAIEKATARAGFFDPLITKDITPGHQLYLERVRDHLLPFKAWLERNYGWGGQEYYRSRYSSTGSNVELMLAGDRYPTSQSGKGPLDEDERRNFKADEQYRIDWLQQRADEYLAQVQEYLSFIDPASLKLTVDNFQSRYLDAAAVAKRDAHKKEGIRGVFVELLTPRAKTDMAHLWDRGKFRRDMGTLTTEDHSVRDWIEKQTTLTLPDKTKPLRWPRLDRVTREGMTDQRKGQDVTPATAKATFGFADIGFGGWVGSRQDQDHLNYGFDAFYDLAQHFGIPVNMIGLGGQLHLTIGALGQGSFAAAHFQKAQPHPNGGSVPVINLTNTKGDGTVFHEWGHAFDIVGAKGEWPEVRRKIITFLQRKTPTPLEVEQVARRFLSGSSWWNGQKKSGAIANAVYSMQRGTFYGNYVMGDTQYFRDAKAMDDGRPKDKPYWSNDKELFARALESWAVDTMTGINTYLINPAFVGEGKTTKASGYRGTPYPTGAERKLVAGVMGALAKSVSVVDGQLSVSLDAFNAALPEDIAAGEARRVELSTEEGMRAFMAQMEAEAQADEQAKAEAARREAEEADRQAADLLAALAPPPPAQAMGPPTTLDLEALFDEAAAELQEEVDDNPKATEPGAAVAELAEDAAPDKAKIIPKRNVAGGVTYVAEPITDAQTKTAAKIAAEAAKLGVTGLTESMQGLVKLFGGGPGRLNSFPSGFDEDAYRQAKPHFATALKAFQDAGKTLKDLFRFLIQEFGVGIKEYALRFAQDEGLTLGLDAAPTASASSRLADWVADRLRANADPLDWRELFAQADAAWGGTQAEGRYTPKDAYDAMEAGLNRFLLRYPNTYTPVANAEAAIHIIASLGNLTARLPTQTKRTDEMDSLQQFSTVPGYAYAAAWVANITADDTVLEPSAGVGGLATFAKIAGAKLILNELSARRAGVLRDLFPGAHVSQENAEQIDNVLPASLVPSVVLMNPPFSNSAGGVKGDTTIATQHLEQALSRMAEGGRLVAIVGDGMRLDAPAFAKWWARMQAKYDVRAVVPVDGAGYAKYGTTFDNVLVVIDKVKPAAERAIITAPAKAYADLVGILAEVRNERPIAAVPVVAGDDLERDAVEPVAAEPDEGGAGAGGLGVDSDRPADVGGGNLGGKPGVGGARGGRGRGAGAGRPGGAVRDHVGGAGTVGGDVGAGSGARAGAADAGPDSGVTVTSGTAAQVELTESIFEQYVPQKLRVPGAKPHAGELVQSAAMASVLPPDIGYTPNLPGKVVDQGLLSIAQLEAVAYAGQAHEQLLPNEQRRGFFIGDGTGVGKGREIGGIILDNMRRGRKRAVWVSEKPGLLEDAKRDFGDVSGDPDLIVAQGKTQAEGQIRHEGILFTTYATLRQGAKSQDLPLTDRQLLARFPKGTPFKFDTTGERTVGKFDVKNGFIVTAYGSRIAIDRVTEVGGIKDWQLPPPKAEKKAAQSRVDQIVAWLGKDFDGVVVFDEAHNAGNAISMPGERGGTEVSAQAKAVVDLQEKLPKARVVYVSATGATKVSNLSYAVRLGLWGKDTPFPGVEGFIADMMAGGLATMELVARDMKQLGAYIARSLSFNGVTYSRVEHQLTPIQTDIYNRLAEAWQVTLQNIGEALQVTGAVDANGKAKNKNAVAAAKSQFWSTQQRFFNQIITSMQMPTVLEQMERDMAAGDALVLQLVNTNEAQQERALAKKQEGAEEGAELELDDLDLTPRDMLIQMVEKSFPVQQQEDVVDASTGKTTSRPMVDSAGKPVINRAALALRDKLLDDLRNIRVPDGPLEMVLNHFGPAVVAEVTGRSRRVVRKPNEAGEVVAQIENRGQAAARADAEAFIADKKRILVFSDAGGTGFSFHASLKAKNQRKRKHYLIQPGWRADKAVQGFGRTHRTNQASAPHYYLAATNIPAHARFLSSIARRLDQLGALTKGQRDTANQGLFSEKDNLESIYAGQAVRQLLEDVRAGQLSERPVFENGDKVELIATPGVEYVVTHTVNERDESMRLQAASDGSIKRVTRDKVVGGVSGLTLPVLLRQMGLENIVDENNQFVESKFPPTSQFLNRMLSLTLDVQDTVFHAFIARMEEKVEVAISRGELDTGLETIKAIEAKVVNDEVIYTDPRTKAETRLVELDLTQANTFYPFPNIRFQLGGEWMVNEHSGRVWLKVPSGTHTDTRTGAVTPKYRMMGTGGTALRNESDFATKPGHKPPYRPIDEVEAKALWEKENAERPATIQRPAAMVVGALLPIWDRLKTDARMRVVRTQTTDGQRLLGKLVPQGELADLRKRFNVSSAAAKMTPAELMAAVLGGKIAELSNGWTLRRAMVSGGLRIEITDSRGQALQLWGPAEKELIDSGIIKERIEWKDRFFVPTGAAGVPPLGDLIRTKPAVDLIDPKAAAAPGDPNATPQFQVRPTAGTVRFDADSGWGNTPNGQNIDYLGFTVMMRPSVFLKLAAPRSEPIRAGLTEAMRAGQPIAPAFLQVDFRGGTPRIHGHEGRSRMMAALEIQGDIPVPVQILPTGGDRARDITPALRKALQERAQSQATHLGPGRTVTDTYLEVVANNPPALQARGRAASLAGTRVVDADGKPLIVYHGTLNTFEDFDPARRGEATGAPSAREGFFFASNPTTALSYATGAVQKVRKASAAEAKAIARLKELTGEGAHRAAFNYRQGRYDSHPQARAIKYAVNLFSAAQNMRGEQADDYFADDSLAGEVKAVYLNLRNPLEVDQGGVRGDEPFSEIIARAKAAGHDGVIIRNTDDPGGVGDDGEGTDVFIAFDAAQVVPAAPAALQARDETGRFAPNGWESVEPDPRTTTPVTVAVAQAVVDGIQLAGLKSDGYTVEVVENTSELPTGVRAQIQSADQHRIGGVHVRHGGQRKLYIVASGNYSKRQVEEAVLHEAYHAGFRLFYGPEALRKLHELVKLGGGIDGIIKMADKHGIDLSHYRARFEADPNMPPPVRAALLADELLAWMAQKAPSGLRQKALEVLGAIRQWLRDHGFTKLQQLSDADLALVIRNAGRAARDPARVHLTLRERPAQEVELLEDAPPAFQVAPTRHMGPALDALDASLAEDETLLGRLQHKAEDWRPAWLGALTLRHLAELGQGLLPQLTSYNDVVTEMAADRNKMMQRTADIADRWAEFMAEFPALAAQLAEMMHDATIAGVDPAEPFQPGRTGSTRRGPDVLITPAEINRRIQRVVGERATTDNVERWYQLDAEVGRLREMLQAEQARRAAYPSLVARWTDLPAPAQALYVEVRNAYRAQSSATLDALVTRILRLEIADEHKTALVDRMRLKFEEAKVQAPYFPLARFGEFWVSAMRNGERSFWMYENHREWRNARLKLATEGYEDIRAGRKISTVRSLDGASGSFVSEVQDILDGAGVDDDIKDEVYQLYLRTLPDLSTRKHFIHRKKTEGYSQDALRAFGANMFHGAHQVARLKHTQDLAHLMDEAKKEAAGLPDPEDAQRASALYNEMLKRHDWVLSPRDSALVSKISALGFVYFLGITPAAGLVNLTQTAVTALPIIGSRYGAKATMNALTQAGKLAGRHILKGTLREALVGDERAAYDTWLAEGTIDVTQAHALAALAETDSTQFNHTAHKAMNVVSYAFHKTEVLNRQVTALAAYRLARAAGKDHPTATDYAAKATWEAHFDYSNANRSRFMQSGAAKVLLMFRQYALNMTWYLARNGWLAIRSLDPTERGEARKKLAGSLGMTAVFSGALGLPMAWAVFGVLNAMHALFDDDDEPWNAETAFQNWLAETVGADVATTLTRGVGNGVFGIDLASRTSLNHLWLREADRELEGRDRYHYWLEQLAGPMGGLLANQFTGAELIRDGQVGRGMETMLPKALKDGLKALRYATEGANTLRGDPLVEELSIPQVVMQAVGFTPAEVAARYDANRAAKNYEQKILDQRSSLLNGYALALRMEDPEAQAAAITKIARWNSSFPEIAIDEATLRRSMLARQRYSATAEGGIHLNPKLAERAREQGAFAE